MNLTVAVLHYETTDLTLRLIDQLKEFQRIIIIDDGSALPLTIRDPRIRVYRSEENMGFIKSFNFAMAYARQFGSAVDATVWVLNTDIEGITRPMAEALFDYLWKNPDIAAASPAITPSPHLEMSPNQLVYRRTRFIDFVCPMIKMSAWHAVGEAYYPNSAGIGLDPGLKGYGCDLDWCYRARRARFNLAVLPRFKVKHEMGGTVKRITDAKGHDDIQFMSNYLCEKWSVASERILKKGR